jgi:hypothetical protein
VKRARLSAAVFLFDPFTLSGVADESGGITQTLNYDHCRVPGKRKPVSKKMAVRLFGVGKNSGTRPGLFGPGSCPAGDSGFLRQNPCKITKTPVEGNRALPNLSGIPQSAGCRVRDRS